MAGRIARQLCFSYAAANPTLAPGSPAWLSSPAQTAHIIEQQQLEHLIIEQLSDSPAGLLPLLTGDDRVIERDAFFSHMVSRLQPALTAPVETIAAETREMILLWTAQQRQRQAA